MTLMLLELYSFSLLCGVYVSYRLAVTQGDLYVLAIHPVCRRRQAGHSVHNAIAILSHVQENQRFCVIYDFLCIIFAIYIFGPWYCLPYYLNSIQDTHCCVKFCNCLIFQYIKCLLTLCSSTQNCLEGSCA